VAPTVISPGTGASLSSLDLIFCIDVTGSMDDDIDSVKAAAANIVGTIAEKHDDYRVAIIAYRDWDDSAGYAMFEDYSFSTDTATIISNINSLSVGGGDDTPEAVFEALMRAIDSTSVGSWRPNVNKQVILMGDAPPHDPSREGLTPAIVAQAADDADPVVIQSIVVGNDDIYDAEAVEAFRELANLTKGNFFEADNAARVPEILQETIADIETPNASPSSNLVLWIGGGLCLLLMLGLGAAVLVILFLGKRPRLQHTYQPPPPYPQQGPSTGMVMLCLLQGQAYPVQYPLSQPIVRLGRATQSNEIVISDPRASSHHAEIRWQGGGHVIHDLQSTNGTFVNGGRVFQPHPLRPGDRVALGGTEWLYQRT
jgi:hypothetical protein